MNSIQRVLQIFRECFLNVFRRKHIPVQIFGPSKNIECHLQEVAIRTTMELMYADESPLLDKDFVMVVEGRVQLPVSALQGGS